jgi:hypothetical protein
VARSTSRRPQLAFRALQFFEGRLVEGDLKTGGHILQATSGSGPNRQVFNYSTDRVVGNGSFGVVFQATCLETGETVRALANTPKWHVPTAGHLGPSTGQAAVAATGKPAGAYCESRAKSSTKGSLEFRAGEVI